MKMTRRQLAAAVSAVAATATSTLAEPQSQPAADRLADARDQMKLNADALARLPLPMAVEPAFQFKV